MQAVIVGGASGMGRATAEKLTALAVAIVENQMLNGSVIRLDGGQRFAAK